MRSGTRHAAALAVASGLACLANVASSGEEAPSGGRYRIERSTIDGGGERSQGGAFVLVGTIGQPDAARSSGGKHSLHGGFWATAAGADAPPGGDALFADGFE